jgi:hypothetical protein
LTSQSNALVEKIVNEVITIVETKLTVVDFDGPVEKIVNGLITIIKEKLSRVNVSRDVDDVIALHLEFVGDLPSSQRDTLFSRVRTILSSKYSGLVRSSPDFHDSPLQVCPSVSRSGVDGHGGSKSGSFDTYCLCRLGTNLKSDSSLQPPSFPITASIDSFAECCQVSKCTRTVWKS